MAQIRSKATSRFEHALRGIYMPAERHYLVRNTAGIELVVDVLHDKTG